MCALRKIVVLVLFIPVIVFGQNTPKTMSLDDCIRQALEKNPNLIMSDLNNQVAEKDYLNSYSSILPTLDVRYSGSKYERGPTSYLGNDYIGKDLSLPFTVNTTIGRTYYLSYDINQNIFDGGRWYLNIKKGKYNKTQNAYSYRSSRQNVIVSVRQYYLDLLKQEKLLDVKKQAVDRSEDQLNRTKSMYEVGSVAQIDVYRSQVNLGQDQIAYMTQKNTTEEARRNLNIAMGREPNDPLQIDENIQLDKTMADLQTLTTQALAQNPDLRAQEFTVKGSDMDVKIAASRFLPNVSAFYSYSRRVPQFKGLYQELNREYNWSIGLSVSWNLFNGFSDFLTFQKAKLADRYQKEQLAYDKLNLQSKVSTLVNNLKAYEDIIKINQTNLDASKEDYRLAEERYRLGSGTLLDLREAQVNLATAEQTLVTAEFDSYITYAELQQALGQLVNSYK